MMGDARPVDPISVVVIAGGRSPEHEVSLASGVGVMAALAGTPFRATLRIIGRDGGWRTADGVPIAVRSAVATILRADAVIPILHGVPGEDGAMAGFLETLGVPIVGSGVRAGALGVDKRVSKMLAEELGIATARAVRITREGAVAGTRADELVPPVVVKPNAAGSSIGVRLVRDRADLSAAVEEALEVDESVLVEEYVGGAEVDVAVFRDRGGALRVGPTLAVPRAAGGIFGTDDKYGSSPAFLIPAPIPAAATAAIESAARRLYDAFGCGGVARFDFFVRGEEVVFNEVNTAPGMSIHSQVPRMFRAAGMTDAELWEELVHAAL